MSEQQNFTGVIEVVEAARANAWLKSGIAISLKTLMPVFLAGTMQCCALLEEQRSVSVFTLFDGFQNRFRELIRVGLLYTCLHMLSIFVLAWFIATSAGPLFHASLEKLSNAVAEGAALDLSMLVPPAPSVLIKSAILWMLLSIPALMLLCFSPLLVRLYGVDVYSSIQTSFTAVWRNRAAFCSLLLSLLFLVLIFLLPIMVLMFILKLLATPVAPLLFMTTFFITMLIIRPILIASIFAAHKDIFNTREPRNDVLMA